MLHNVASVEIRAEIVDQHQDPDAWLITQGRKDSKKHPIRAWLPKSSCKMFKAFGGICFLVPKDLADAEELIIWSERKN